MAQLRSVTCHMGSHSATCYPTQVNTARLNPSHADRYGTRFTYPGGMEGWVDLVDLIAPRTGVEPATFRSRVRHSTTATTKKTTICYCLLRTTIIITVEFWDFTWYSIEYISLQTNTLLCYILLDIGCLAWHHFNPINQQHLQVLGDVRGLSLWGW